jgi:parvulin-like peptidyl-prolyl isomerase
MIEETLVMQAAERDRVTVTDAELNQHINQLRMMMGQEIGRQPTDEEFALAVMNETGQSLPVFRESARRQLVAQKYLLTQKQDLFANVREPTEAEILNLYNLSRGDFFRPETIRFSMIHVPFGPDAASRARARELADRLNREIGSDPSRFDEAVLRGQAPNSGYQAGDGGFIPRNLAAVQMLGEEFVNTAFSMRQGEVSRVIQGNQGFQIIKVITNLPQRNLELDDIMIPGTTETVRQNIAGALLQQRLQETTARAAQELMTELRAGNPFQITESNLNW